MIHEFKDDFFKCSPEMLKNVAALFSTKSAIVKEMAKKLDIKPVIYPFEKDSSEHDRNPHRNMKQGPAIFASTHRFHVKLKYYTNYVDITHPTEFFISAENECHAKQIALQKFPSGSDITATEYFE